jgi:hypothetical protein
LPHNPRPGHCLPLTVVRGAGKPTISECSRLQSRFPDLQRAHTSICVCLCVSRHVLNTFSIMQHTPFDLLGQVCHVLGPPVSLTDACGDSKIGLVSTRYLDTCTHIVGCLCLELELAVAHELLCCSVPLFCGACCRPPGWHACSLAVERWTISQWWWQRCCLHRRCSATESRCVPWSTLACGAPAGMTMFIAQQERRILLVFSLMMLLGCRRVVSRYGRKANSGERR